MEQLVDNSIDKYEVVSVLGSGATSVVYFAYDTFTERPVAVKVFRPEILSDPEHGQTYRKLIANEASLAGRLNHPHIVGIYDAVLGQDKCYLVMEYVKGETLEKYCQPEHLLPIERVVEIIFKCALALDFASRNGVIHRDIKPANIMICQDGVVKIADFGAAVLLKSDQTTITGIGSPAYMSPEQIRNAALTHQTDIYSLGVVMYKLLTGKLPFEAESSYSLSHKILNEEPTSIRTHRPLLPLRLSRIVAKAMRKNLDDRYANWRDFAKDISNLAALDLPPEADSETQKFNMLKSLDFFKDFSDIELWEVLRFCLWGRVAPGTVLVRENEEGDFFFILIEGKVRVTKKGKTLSVLDKGHCFGEMCYIRHGSFTRTATIMAETPVVLLKIKADSLRNASENCQLGFNSVFMNILVDRLAQANSKLTAMY